MIELQYSMTCAGVFDINTINIRKGCAHVKAAPTAIEKRTSQSSEGDVRNNAFDVEWNLNDAGR